MANQLFFVQSKNTQKLYAVYGTNVRDNATFFLVYMDDYWVWAPATQFKPAP